VIAAYFCRMAFHDIYMQRCLQLALLGAGNVAPNPMVGAVLVHGDVIIGEGYHKQFGKAHAEVNCINSVKEKNRPCIEKSTMYVSLEPCAHFGKTPPCADLIIANKIPAVVIACMDNYQEVNGKGIEKLRAAGVTVTVGVLEKEALELNQRFFTFHQRPGPYIILKWAESKNGKIAAPLNLLGGTSRALEQKRFLISNEITNRLVHKWRSEETAIMVGTNTALYDNPSLTTRLWKGNNPVRVLLDKDLKVPVTYHLLDGQATTIVFNNIKNATKENIIYSKLIAGESITKQVLEKLYQLKIQSIIVEGGAKLLQSFIDEGSWDEARVITNQELIIGDGINAPLLKNQQLYKTEKYLSDQVSFYKQSAAIINE
jgi:diaminohydroxyphosphoribosylaminopyrimidine deaminase / 5-amino-6-(5-phosphoribosylamino)uracil reductase